MTDNFPLIRSYQFTKAITSRVTEEQKELFRFVKENGLDAPAIFREDGINGLLKAKAHIISKRLHESEAS